VAAPAQAGWGSLFEMMVAGGPIMIPIGICSVIALAYIVERWVRLTPGKLGGGGFGRDLVAAVRDGGVVRGLALCEERRTKPLARIMSAALARWNSPFLEREKAVEDAGVREVKRLSTNLRPLVVIVAIAPLLGLLGTVWGMILAFSTIALQEGLGKPEMLAAGIGQALITTAAGLAIAIPTQAAYFYLKSRIDRFARLTEQIYQDVSASLDVRVSAEPVSATRGL
jgi:biopolymer transport protein ExbB